MRRSGLSILFYSLLCALSSAAASSRSRRDANFRMRDQVKDLETLQNEFEAMLRASSKNLNEHNAARVAVCLLIRDERPEDVLDWVNYHSKVMGVGKVYVYDHSSQIPPSSYLAEHVKSGLVDVKTFNYDNEGPDEYKHGRAHEIDVQGTRVQMRTYTECFRTYGHRHKFMGVWDVDEYVELLNTPTPMSVEPLADFMEEFSDEGGLKINWRLFGACGHAARPYDPVPQAYTCCTPKHHELNRHGKTITTMQWWMQEGSPRVVHVHDSIGTKDIVDENHVKQAEHTIASDRIVLRHYHTKSYEDYKAKNRRSWPGRPNAYSFFNFDQYQQLSTEKCSPL